MASEWRVVQGWRPGDLRATGVAPDAPDGGHTRWCPRCGCKLSRYAAAHETYCAPCERVLVSEGQLTLPPFEPEASSAEQARAAVTDRGRRSRKPGEPVPHNWAAIQASVEARRKPGSKWSRECACGGRKGSGAVMCRACRYPDRWVA